MLNIQQSIFTELVDFLVSQPSLQAITDYQSPPGIQEYVDRLLEKNREEGLSPEERIELERILTLADVINLAKAKAKLKLAGEA